MTLENLDKFKRLLVSTQTECGPHEAVFGILENLAKENEDVLEWIAEQFNSNSCPYNRADLARIAVFAGKRGEFEKFLREHERWEDSDFG